MRIVKFWVNHDKEGSFVNRLRRERFQVLEKYINRLSPDSRPINILDVGGDRGYWKHVGWKKEKAHITLLNLSEIDIPEEDKPYFSFHDGDALKLPFKKGEFDLVFSNSVIEHVGSKKNQKIFAEQVKKISDKYIVQTPSFWFPLEPHSLIPFFQFIPHHLRAILIMIFNINYFPKSKSYKEALKVSRSTIMLTKKEFRALFPEGELYTEKLFGLPKSYTVIKV